MAPGSPPRHAARPNGASSVTPPAGRQDWPAQAADTIEQLVGSVRDKTTGPAITAARWVVYGTFALVVGTAVVVLLAVGAFRVIDTYLPDAMFGDDHTWAAYVLVGALFTVLGTFAWSRRSAPADAG